MLNQVSVINLTKTFPSKQLLPTKQKTFHRFCYPVAGFCSTDSDGCGYDC